MSRHSVDVNEARGELARRLQLEILDGAHNEEDVVGSRGKHARADTTPTQRKSSGGGDFEFRIQCNSAEERASGSDSTIR